MFSTDIDYSVKLKSVLTSQDKLLSEICDTQKKLRESVNERDWDELQYHLASFDALSNKFSQLENERIRCFEYFGLNDGASLNLKDNKISKESINDIQNLYNSVKQRLLASKIENKALNDYIKITTEFLQGVFDNVVPQRKTTVYSRTGSLVKNQPQSMILNTVL
jgi:hypothetical protein